MREWEKNIRKVEPYVPGEQPKDKEMIKLNTNENPYPPSPKVMEAMKQISREELSRYPDPNASMLTSAIANYYGVKESEVFIGVGSDDVLAMSFLTFFNSNKPIFFPEITYSFYDVWADLFQIPYEKKELDENFRLKLSDYEEENGGIVIANPNAPTSLYEELSGIEEVIKKNQKSVVIIDEAYIDFAGESAISLLEKYENLLVIQTFSKSRSMAGMRIGFAIGNERLIQALNDVKSSYNSYTMNQTALYMGKAVIEDKEYFKECCEKIIATRERVKKELEQLGFDCLPSQTNFLFMTSKKVNAEQLFLYLKEHKVLARYFKKPRIDNYLRVTIGTDEEMNQFLDVVKEYLTSQK